MSRSASLYHGRFLFAQWKRPRPIAHNAIGNSPSVVGLFFSTHRTPIQESNHNRVWNRGTIIKRCMSSSWTTRGQDLLADSLSFGNRPKVVLEAYGPTGFDVLNIVEKTEETEEAISGSVHMNGSILVFPHACFLWKIERMSDITVESLSAVILHRPKLSYLFLGVDEPIPPLQFAVIKKELQEKEGIVVEQLDVTNAMGTFNILNGEDRPVAAALVLNTNEE